MKYCVKKDTTIIIDGSDNQDEVMLENAIVSGFKVEEVEILTEEEYKARVDNLPMPIVNPTLEERLASAEEMLSMMMEVN